MKDRKQEELLGNTVEKFKLRTAFKYLHPNLQGTAIRLFINSKCELGCICEGILTTITEKQRVARIKRCGFTIFIYPDLPLILPFGRYFPVISSEIRQTSPDRYETEFTRNSNE